MSLRKKTLVPLHENVALFSNTSNTAHQKRYQSLWKGLPNIKGEKVSAGPFHFVSLSETET